MTINASLDEPTAIQYEIWEQMKRLIEKGNRYFPNMTVDWIKLNARADRPVLAFSVPGFITNCAFSRIIPFFCDTTCHVKAPNCTVQMAASSTTPKPSPSRTLFEIAWSKIN